MMDYYLGGELLPRPTYIRIPPPPIKAKWSDDGFIRSYRNNKIDTCYSKCGRYGFVRTVKSILPPPPPPRRLKQGFDFKWDFSWLKFWK